MAASLAIGLIVADPLPAHAQAASDAPTVEELLREIEQLRRRVETLERQVGATAAEPPPAAQEEERDEAAAPAGPPPAEIGAIEATEQEVERALERALVQTGALLLPAGTAEIEPSFSYSRQEEDAPVFVSEDGEQSLAAGKARSDSLEAGLALRVGLPLDSQFQIDVPYLYEDDSTVTQTALAAPREESRDSSGFGDVGVILSKALLRERGWRPNLFGSVQWDTDTGETEDGIPLGSGFHELSGTLTASKRQDPLVFVLDVAYTTSLEDNDVDPGDQISFSIGTLLAASPETSLRFFLSQSFVDEVEVGGREIPGSDQVVGTFVIGASSIVSARVLLDVTAGIGLTEDASDYFVRVSLPIQFDLPFRF
jgi:hypothetical protein